MKITISKITTTLLLGAVLTTATMGAEKCRKEYYAPKWDHQAPTVDAFNYVRAETDEQFKGYIKNYNAFGKFLHSRKPYDVHNQVTVSGNRDTIYSFGVFDLSKSPLTIELPETNGRYMSLMMVSQDHDVYPAYYAPGKWTFTQEEIGTRYVMFAIRTFADPGSEKDMKEAYALQDAVKVIQKDKGDPDGMPAWNIKEMEALRDSYNKIGSTTSSSIRYFGVKCDRSYLENAMGVAVGWGGLQAKDAYYIPGEVEKNDGKTAYVLHVPKDVPVKGFWSVTVYGKDRFMVPNKLDVYSYNNVTAQKNSDGSIDIHFGGDPKAKNYIPITPGWVYIVRLYRPDSTILEGKWQFPKPVEAK